MQVRPLKNLNLDLMRNTALILVTIALLTGCGFKPDVDMSTTAAGGAIGTAVGAGSGALIGHSMRGGDVGDSALVGAGVGLASGLALGAAYQAADHEAALERGREQIRTNRTTMIKTDAELGRLREKLQLEHAQMDIDPAEGRRLYVGPSIGTDRPVN